jgi:hypothetical protein
MSRQRTKQRRNPARRPWWRPLVGLGLLAGWLAVSKRGRQAVKVAKEQASKARQKLAGARPARTTTVAPPTGAPPGPVLAEVTNNDGGDEKPGRSRTPRRTPRRLNRPRTSSAAAPGPGGRGAAGTARFGSGLGCATGQASPKTLRTREQGQIGAMRRARRLPQQPLVDQTIHAQALTTKHCFWLWLGRRSGSPSAPSGTHRSRKFLSQPRPPAPAGNGVRPASAADSRRG